MNKSDLHSMYSEDLDFISTYHGNINWSVDDCVVDSWNNIKDLELYLYDFGYIAINRLDLVDRLAGFFIRPEFRNLKTKSRFFTEVYSLMPNTFMTCVHSSNYKAIKFLSLQGQITKQDNITTYLVFRQGE